MNKTEYMFKYYRYKITETVKRRTDKVHAKTKDKPWCKNATQKDKYWSTRYPKNTRGELWCSESISSFSATNDITALLLNDPNIIWYGNRVGNQQQYFFLKWE